MLRNMVKTGKSWCSAVICNRDLKIITTATIISSFIFVFRGSRSLHSLEIYGLVFIEQ